MTLIISIVCVSVNYLRIFEPCSHLLLFLVLRIKLSNGRSRCLPKELIFFVKGRLLWLLQLFSFYLFSPFIFFNDLITSLIKDMSHQAPGEIQVNLFSSGFI